MLRLNTGKRKCRTQAATIQIQPMLRLNLRMQIIAKVILKIQIQPMLRLNSKRGRYKNKRT